MKKCPNCKRTYADDGFTFCLEDGALLSPPYDASKSDAPVSTIQSGGPPPTAVLPRSETAGQEVPPTVKSSPMPSYRDETERQIGAKPESPRRTSPVKYVVIGLVALVIVVTGVGFLGLYVSGTSNCPRLVISCGPSEPATYCSLVEDRSPRSFNYTDNKPISAALCSRSVILLQSGAPPEGVTKVSWSASLGTIRTENQLMMSIDTSGLAGKTIEVKANVTSSSWFCSTTVSKSFVVPAGAGPAR